MRHKTLDLVGDLALAGYDLAGHFVAHCSGHRLNAELVSLLLAEAARERLGADGLAGRPRPAVRRRPKEVASLMATNISDRAEVDPRAEIDDDVEIGPFCVVGPQVRIGRGSKLIANVTLLGRVTIGEENKFYPGVVIGGEPQDMSYRGSDTQVVIGDGNMFREGVTVNRATEKEDGVTRVGNDCFLMACCHVAHDCLLGDRMIMANGTLLAGHVRIHDHATLSGNVGVHQFTTIGSYSFIGGLSRVLHDVPPYMLVEGNPARPRCINVVALKRNNFPAEYIEALAESPSPAVPRQGRPGSGLRNPAGPGQLVPPVNHLLNFVQEQQEGRYGRAANAAKRREEAGKDT